MLWLRTLSSFPFDDVLCNKKLFTKANIMKAWKIPCVFNYVSRYACTMFLFNCVRYRWISSTDDLTLHVSESMTAQHVVDNVCTFWNLVNFTHTRGHHGQKHHLYPSIHRTCNLLYNILLTVEFNYTILARYDKKKYDRVLQRYMSTS